MDVEGKVLRITAKGKSLPQALSSTTWCWWYRFSYLAWPGAQLDRCATSSCVRPCRPCPSPLPLAEVLELMWGLGRRVL